jgi:hypothetical protein
MRESARFSLYGLPKFTMSLDLTLACTESANSPVFGSKNVTGMASSSTDQTGDPSAAVVAATPAESFDPYPTTGDRENRSLMKRSDQSVERALNHIVLRCHLPFPVVTHLRSRRFVQYRHPHASKRQRALVSVFPRAAAFMRVTSTVTHPLNVQALRAEGRPTEDPTPTRFVVRHQALCGEVAQQVTYRPWGHLSILVANCGSSFTSKVLSCTIRFVAGPRDAPRRRHAPQGSEVAVDTGARIVLPVSKRFVALKVACRLPQVLLSNAGLLSLKAFVGIAGNLFRVPNLMKTGLGKALERKGLRAIGEQQ